MISLDITMRQTVDQDSLIIKLLLLLLEQLLEPLSSDPLGLSSALDFSHSLWLPQLCGISKMQEE